MFNPVKLPSLPAAIFLLLQVNMAGAQAISCTPNSVYGGFPVSGSLHDYAAPSEDTTVTLTSANPSAVQVPATVTLLAGSTQTSFNVTTSLVAADTDVLITAVFPSATVNTNLHVATIKLDDIRIDAVVGGGSSQGRIQINAYAPPGGYQISLSSENPSLATVPGTVTIPEGSYQLTFTVNTSPTTVDTDVRITATTLSSSLYNKIVVMAPRVQSLTLDPTSLIGGNSAAATVAMNGAMPSDMTVYLSSDRTSVGVPTSVVVPAGHDHATFTVTSSTVDADTTATLTASAAATSASTAVLVSPLRLIGLVVNPKDGPGGLPTTGTVTFNGPVPLGGAFLNLSSDHPVEASVPATLTAPSGADTVQFSVTTKAIWQDTAAVISASFGDATLTAPLMIRATRMSNLWINPSTIAGGDDATGTLIIDGPAPAGGFTAVIVVINDHTTVPASVTITEGSQAVSFAIHTQTVVQTEYGSLFASTSTQSLSIAFQIVDPVLSATDGLKINPTSVIAGGTATGTVTLAEAAPVDVKVKLASSMPAATVPTSVTVLKGATTASFTISTGGVKTNVVSVITATIGTSKASVKFTIIPVLKTFAVAPNSVIGGATATGTVTLNGPAPAGGQTVNLTSANPAASVPASVVVPAGSTSVTFTVGTVPVSSLTTGAISASAPGITKTANFSVKPPILASLAFLPASVKQGLQTTGTVTLSGKAASDFVITLTSGNPSALSVPATVTVPAGSNTATFTATAGNVTVQTAVTITAKDSAGTTKTKPVTVKL